MFKSPQLTSAGAQELDDADPLRAIRSRFILPGAEDSTHPVVYLAGNSLGPQAAGVPSTMTGRLSEWAQLAVKGWHDTEWMTVDRRIASSMARIVGARDSEVAVGGTLTSNLHALMASFFRPQGERNCVLLESNPFPSDRYAVAGQASWHGLDPSRVILTGRETGDDAGVLEVLERHGDQIALVLLAGINYYSGQLYDMQTVIRAAREKGCVVGLDLAHAAGNVRLSLHEWGPDFAAWCGYKYLNGGPGAPAALFVHERHHGSALPRLAGWWGHDEDTRFAMPATFVPESGAKAWQISTPPVLGLAPLEASMDIFDEVGMPAVVAKSRELTGYLESLLRHRLPDRVEVVTPIVRGAQLSLRIAGGRAVFRRLSASGVVCDWREPDVIRVAPAPLYNTFLEMVLFVDRLEAALDR